MSIRSFTERGTEDIFEDVDTKGARGACPQALWPRARRKLDDINQAKHCNDLKKPPGNKLHPLKGSRVGQWAIAINDQYRICFGWDGVDAVDVEIIDYH
jgi:proteic killer suppression protein